MKNEVRTAEDLQYIILQPGTKKPAHAVKGGGQQFEAVKAEPDLAVIVPDGFVVLDFDSAESAQTALEIVDALDIRTKVFKTERGLHMWFRAPDGDAKNFVKCDLACGLVADMKAGGRSSLVTVKRKGAWRLCVRNKSLSFSDLEVMPKFFSKWCQESKCPLQFLGMGVGAGRNQSLFSHVLRLHNLGFSKEEIVETLDIINSFVFAEPLRSSEFSAVTRDEVFSGLPVRVQDIGKGDGEFKELQPGAFTKETFKHSLMGKYLIKKFTLLSKNGEFFRYKDGYYQRIGKEVEKEMIVLYPDITSKQRAEVFSYILVVSDKDADDLKSDPFFVNCKNGRVDIRTGELFPHSPESYDFAQIPVVYDAFAESAVVDQFLSDVFCGDEEQIQLFLEMAGSCLYRKVAFHAWFLLLGEGSNGKSTVISLLRALLGAKNCSYLSLEQFSCGGFDIPELDQKFANLGDDIEDKPIQASGLLKKISAGNTVTTARKFGQPFEMESSATLVFSSNSLPFCSDRTNGFYRRMKIIKFQATFSDTDPGFDPDILEKITTQEALSYLLSLSITAFQTAIARKSFVKTTAGDDAMKEYKMMNSTALNWIYEEDIGEKFVLTRSKKDIYIAFRGWAKDAGISHIPTSRTFYSEVGKFFGLDLKGYQKRVGASREWYFKKVGQVCAKS